MCYYGNPQMSSRVMKLDTHKLWDHNYLWPFGEKELAALHLLFAMILFQDSSHSNNNVINQRSADDCMDSSEVKYLSVSVFISVLLEF